MRQLINVTQEEQLLFLNSIGEEAAIQYGVPFKKISRNSKSKLERKDEYLVLTSNFHDGKSWRTITTTIDLENEKISLVGHEKWFAKSKNYFAHVASNMLGHMFKRRGEEELGEKLINMSYKDDIIPSYQQ